MNTTKICTKCKIEKSATEFNKDNKRKSGLQCSCRECQKKTYNNNKDFYKIAHRKYRESHKEDKKKQDKEYFEANKEKILEYRKKWYLDNKERIEEKRKKYYQDNKDKIDEKNKEWIKNNKDKYLKWQKEYGQRIENKIKDRNRSSLKRLKKREGDVTNEQLIELINDTKVCYWCNSKLDKKNRRKFHIDHYVPLSKGGKHTISNLVVSCQTCNLNKSAKDPFEFAQQNGRLL